MHRKSDAYSDKFHVTFGRYSHAIVSRIPDSFATSCLGSTEQINLMEARREHETFIRVLRNLNVDVIELPADELFPDSPFVEDTAIVVNGLALICKPGHPSRAKEVRSVHLSLLSVTCSKVE